MNVNIDTGKLSTLGTNLAERINAMVTCLEDMNDTLAAGSTGWEGNIKENFISTHKKFNTAFIADLNAYRNFLLGYIYDVITSVG